MNANRNKGFTQERTRKAGDGAIGSVVTVRLSDGGTVSGPIRKVYGPWSVGVDYHGQTHVVPTSKLVEYSA